MAAVLVCSSESENTKSVSVKSVSEYITALVCESESSTSLFLTAGVCPTEALTEYEDAERCCDWQRLPSRLGRNSG